MISLFSKIKSSPLLSGSVIVFGASVISNVLSYAYHLYLGRSLGPEGYGEFSSLNSIIYLLMVVTTVIATSLVKYFSRCKAKGLFEQATDLYERSTSKIRKMLFIGLGIALLVSFPLSLYLHLNSWVSIVIVYIIFSLFTLNTINTSFFSGYQFFGSYSLITTLGILLRFMFVVPAARFGVTTALLSYAVANTATYSIARLMARKSLSIIRKRFDVSMKSLISSSRDTFAILLSMTSLYSTDIVLVRHLFTQQEAGWYAGVAVLGKIIFYASSAIGQVVLPIVAERSCKGKQTIRVIGTAIAIVTVLSLIILAIYALSPEGVIHLLFGPSYNAAVPILVPFGLFMVMYSIINIITMGLLGSSKTQVWLVYSVAAIAQIIGITLFHSSLQSVITVNCFVASGLLIIVFWYLIRSQKPATIDTTS